LKQWGVQTGLIGTALGDDSAGRDVAAKLSELGVSGTFVLSDQVETPYEINISDATGSRTYFWKRDPAILSTLDDADLSMIAGAKFVYADWYDGPHVMRALTEAARYDVPVFFNFEHGHRDETLLKRYAPLVSVCQATTDATQSSGDGEATASRLLGAGVETALVTMAEKGCLAADADGTYRVNAPEVGMVDGCAAGATFSAGYILGRLAGWQTERTLRFAVAAASLQCTRVGPVAFPLSEVESLASGLTVESYGPLI
ncbi:MAG: carbohydrate kinase family protein, partial [Chloroflexi bacterium]|nr:carbohydrate kinase family protein [Chloroflexota bacterium]